MTNLAGKKNLANHVLSSAGNSEELSNIPNINGQVICGECKSFSNWEYVSHDFSDPKETYKEVKYRCTEKTKLASCGFGPDEDECLNEEIVYLDENFQPILPGTGGGAA